MLRRPPVIFLPSIHTHTLSLSLPPQFRVPFSLPSKPTDHVCSSTRQPVCAGECAEVLLRRAAPDGRDGAEDVDGLAKVRKREEREGKVGKEGREGEKREGEHAH